MEAYKRLSVGGRIILTSSNTASVKGVPKHAVYSGSKGAIDTFVRCMVWFLFPPPAENDICHQGSPYLTMMFQSRQSTPVKRKSPSTRWLLAPLRPTCIRPWPGSISQEVTSSPTNKSTRSVEPTTCFFFLFFFSFISHFLRLPHLFVYSSRTKN